MDLILGNGFFSDSCKINLMRITEDSISEVVIFNDVLETDYISGYAKRIEIDYSHGEILFFKFWQNNVFMSGFQFNPDLFKKQNKIELYVDGGDSYIYLLSNAKKEKKHSNKRLKIND